MNKNLYEILGVPINADDDLIKSVYRSLGQIYHPDKYKGDKKFSEEKMKEINYAYSILSNPEKREEYDVENNLKSNFYKKETKNNSRFKQQTRTTKNNNYNYHTARNDKWDNFVKEFKNVIFGPKLTPEQKAKQRADDIAYFKRIALFCVGMPLLVAFIFVFIEFYFFIKSIDWLYNRISDRLLMSSIIGIVLGIAFSNPDNYKKDILKNIKIIFITTFSVIIISLFIPERNKKQSNLPSNCKWVNAGRSGELVCN